VSDSVAGRRLPLFYTRPVPLRAESHRHHALAKAADFGFAANAGAVPLNAVEFAAAAHSFPVVFTGGSEPMPVAVLSLTGGRNGFVDADGAWRAGEYVPAYVRRYPFIFFEQREAGQYTLGVDAASTLLRADGEGQPLFSNDGPTEAVQRALEFCRAYQRELLATQQFTKALRDADLLLKRSLNVRRGDGSTQQLSDFQVADEKKLKALPDEVVLDWHRKGYLGAIGAHLISLGCWPRLAARD
jgi:hypothetical protein